MKAHHNPVGGRKKFAHLYLPHVQSRKFRGRMLTKKERSEWDEWIAKSIDGAPLGRKLTLEDVI